MNIRQIIENLFYIKYDLKKKNYEIFFKHTKLENNLGLQLYIKEKLRDVISSHPDIFDSLLNNICFDIKEKNDKVSIAKLYQKDDYLYCIVFIESIVKQNNIAKHCAIDPVTGFIEFSSLVKQELEKKKYIVLIEIKNFNELLISQYKTLHEIIVSFAEFLEAFFIDKFIYISRVNDKQFLIVLDEEKDIKDIIENFLKFTMKMNIRVNIGVVKDDSIEEGYKKALAVIEWNKERNLNLNFYNDIYKKFYNETYKIRMLIIDAIRKNNFEFYFQPYYSLENKKIIGAESLLRIYNDNGEIVSPGKFIDLAERSGLIQEIEFLVINKLFDYQKDIKDINISYNLSALSFSKENIKKLFSDKLNNKITIEITERMILDSKKSKETIDLIKSFGSKVSIDDFGTGYSSLVNLYEFNIDYIKIDMLFVKNMLDNQKSYSIVKNIINLSKDLGLKTIVEGVETKEQFLELKRLGCDIIQGYYIAKPMSFNEFKNFIKEFKIEY